MYIYIYMYICIYMRIHMCIYIYGYKFVPWRWPIVLKTICCRTTSTSRDPSLLYDRYTCTYHIYMSHGTHVNKSSRTLSATYRCCMIDISSYTAYIRVTAHIVAVWSIYLYMPLRISHVTHVNKTCHKTCQTQGVVHRWIWSVYLNIPRTFESCHTCKWVMARMKRSHVTHKVRPFVAVWSTYL